MPWGDGTGPLGFGPMTGRGAGFCAGFGVPGYANPYVFGRGRGRRRWWRPGWGRFAFVPPRFYAGPAFVPGPAPEAEAEFLKEQAKFLEEELEAIKGRLAELEKREQDEEEGK